MRCPPTLQAAQVCAAGQPGSRAATPIAVRVCATAAAASRTGPAGGPPGRRRRKPRGTSRRAWGKETVDQMRDLVAGMVGKRLMYPDLTK